MIGRADERDPGLRDGAAVPRTSHKEAVVPQPRPRLEVAIATESPLFRDVLSRLLDADPDLKIVGQAQSETELTRVLRQERPRAILFDYEALGGTGASIISRLRRAPPATRIVVIAA